MKTTSLFDFFDLRKPHSHVAMISLSVIVTMVIGLSGKYPELPKFPVSIFIMMLVQIEVFISLGAKLFADINFNLSPGTVTRIILIRFIIFIIGCLLLSMIIFIVIQLVNALVNGGDISGILGNFIHTGVHEWFKSTISGLSLGALIFIVLQWQASLRREQKLREESLIFQNETLKTQVNPHFLFNSLNTLSSLIVSDRDIAEKFVNRLASTYRYILENSQKDRIPLQSELSFVREYYDLHRVRDEGKILLSINAPDEAKFEILPVSLQILVENAIKHNMATRENPLEIFIYLEDNSIVVKNTLQRMETQIGSTKIGLKNLAARVKLSSGKNLVIEETNNYFIVKVPLI